MRAQNLLLVVLIGGLFLSCTKEPRTYYESLLSEHSEIEFRNIEGETIHMDESGYFYHESGLIVVVNKKTGEPFNGIVNLKWTEEYGTYEYVNGFAATGKTFNSRNELVSEWNVFDGVGSSYRNGVLNSKYFGSMVAWNKGVNYSKEESYGLNYYEDGSLLDSTSIHYNENGEFIIDGIWKGWHQNGNLWYLGNYENNSMHGDWVYYDENGKLIKTETYEFGTLIAEK